MKESGTAVVREEFLHATSDTYREAGHLLPLKDYS